MKNWGTWTSGSCNCDSAWIQRRDSQAPAASAHSIKSEHVSRVAPRPRSKSARRSNAAFERGRNPFLAHETNRRHTGAGLAAGHDPAFADSRGGKRALDCVGRAQPGFFGITATGNANFNTRRGGQHAADFPEPARRGATQLDGIVPIARGD